MLSSFPSLGSRTTEMNSTFACPIENETQLSGYQIAILVSVPIRTKQRTPKPL